MIALNALSESDLPLILGRSTIPARSEEDAAEDDDEDHGQVERI